MILNDLVSTLEQREKMKYTLGEKMLIDLGYEKVNECVFAKLFNTIVFNHEKKIYGCSKNIFENITMTIELHLAIHQCMIDYGFVESEIN